MDFTALDSAIDTQLRHDVADLRRQAGGGPLLAVAIGMVDDITGFFTAALTEQRYLGWSPKKRNETWHWPSEWGTAADNDPTDGAPGRVTAALWALTGTLSDEGEVDDETYEEIRGEYEARLVAGLARLRAEGLLRTTEDLGSPEAWAWLHYADAYDEDIDLRTFRQLNAAELGDAFARRFEGGFDAHLP